jgi:hypothetical protein
MLDEDAQCYRHCGEEHEGPKGPGKVCNRRHRYFGGAVANLSRLDR